MNSLILVLHLVGAAVTGVAVLTSVLVLIQSKHEYFKRLLLFLSGCLIVQIISGTLLELTAPHPALFTVFCSKIVLYVGAVGVTQAFLFVGMKKNAISTSILPFVYPVLTAVLSLGTVALMLH